MMREPVTSDSRVSFINLHSRLEVFDIAGTRPLCRRCLKHRQGHCLFGGPFEADGRRAA